MGTRDESAPDSDEMEAAMPAGTSPIEQVMLNEVRAARREVAALRGYMDTKFDSLRETTEESADKLELRIREQEQKGERVEKDIRSLLQWRDGTNGENGAADKIDSLRSWQARTLGVMAACGVLSAIVLAAFGAWFTSYLDQKNREHLAFVQQLVQQQVARPAPAPTSDPH